MPKKIQVCPSTKKSRRSRASIRELKQRRRRRRGRRLVKSKFVFYKRNSQLSRSVRYANGSQFQMKIYEITRRRPRYVGDSELGHFTLLFCRGWQRNVQRFTAHVHSYYFPHYTFCLVTFYHPSSSWFAFKSSLLSVRCSYYLSPQAGLGMRRKLRNAFSALKGKRRLNT